MFRSSLRSASDPFRQYACSSCLTQSSGHRVHHPSSQFCRTSSNNSASGFQRMAELVESESPSSPAPTSNNDHSLDISEAPHSTINSDRSGHKPEDANATTANENVFQGSTRWRWNQQRAKPTPALLKAIRGSARNSPLKNPPNKLAAKKEKPVVGNALSDHPTEPPPLSTTTTPPRKSKMGMGERVRLRSTVDRATGQINAEELALTPLDYPRSPVPRLSYDLDRVLFNPGVYQLRDPRSRVFNFDPYLGSIMPVTEFDFASLKEYITSSKDDTLRDIAAKEGKKYIGSSSSMTSVLAHFHYLLSQWRPIDARTVSRGFPELLNTFTRLLRFPAAVFLRYKNGSYAIDADKEFDNANILMSLGKSMEKLLTLPKEEFERYRRSSENKITREEEQAIPEPYHYTTFGDFVMRSQLDAYDPRLPGTGMFDLKTRAVVSIRMNATNFEQGLGYQIKGRYGTFESYEREFYDMIRAAFLKYSLQVRIGRMDGIFVAFHNIERIFGFQYISLPEMDQALHSQTDTALGDKEFKLSLSLWNKVLDRATERFPEQSLRFHFETLDTANPTMYVFAEPVTDDEMHAIQTTNAERIEAYHRRILNLEDPDGDTDEADKPSETLQDQAATGREQSNSEGFESDTPRDSKAPPDENFIADLGKEIQQDQADKKDLFALAVTVKNRVNGKVVERPSNITADDDWEVEYEFNEIEPEHARPLYMACHGRRKQELAGRGEDDVNHASNEYIRVLRQISKAGREYRQEQDAIDKEKGLVVLHES